MRLPRLVEQVGVTMAVVLATTVPSWSEEAPAYRLVDAKLDTDLGRAGHRLGDTAATGLFAQATGTSGSAESAAAPPDGADESASELNRKLTNPVSTLWSLSNQFNNFKLANGHWNNNWNFQPVVPVSLTKDWNLITRPVMPFYNIVPHQTASGQFERTVGLGDMILLELLSPANTGNWVLGAGPTFIFPTATSKFTGHGKWQAGPSGDGWHVGYSGNILANWKAPSGDVWTVPIGLGIGKVVKLGRLPIKLELGLQYMPVRPRNTGQEWDVQVQITPVIPKLIKGTLFRVTG